MLNHDEKNLSKPIVILASSRSDGNTHAFASQVFPSDTADFVDLNKLKIGYFSYTNSNANDDFPPLLAAMLKRQVWVLATPLYWYTMSAQAKTFIDRLSDTIVFHKDLGRQLRGKSLAVLSASITTRAGGFASELMFEKILNLARSSS